MAAAWKAGDKFEYEFVGRALASQGFVTVIPDYRLYPEVKYPEFLEDGARALKWVEDNIAGYHGDPNRVFLAGHSAGAYNAVMLALDKSFTREFGVTIPINGVAAISGPYDFYPFEYGEVRNAFGEAPNPEGTQPVNLVTPDSPPMLLVSGTSDPIVRVAEHRASGAEAPRPGRLGHRDLLRGVRPPRAGDRDGRDVALADAGAPGHHRFLRPLRRFPARRAAARISCPSRRSRSRTR